MNKPWFVQLGDVADFINGCAFKPDDWHSAGLPIIRIQNLTDPDASFNLTERDVDPKYRVVAGDLLVSWSATLGVFEWRGPEALVNQHIFKVVADPRKIDLGFLRHALDASIHEMERFTHGSTMKHINRAEFLAHRIPLPPLDEQQRIAAILDKADALRQKRKQTHAMLAEIAFSTFIELFGDLNENPLGWPIEPLGRLATNCDSRRVPVKESDRDRRPGRYPYYGSVGIIDDIDDFLFEGEHLLVSEDGKHLESRTRPIACMAEGRFWVNNHAHVLSFNGKADLVFLMKFLEYQSIAPYITGIDQIKLNRNSMDMIPVPLPPLELQLRYRAFVEQLKTQTTLTIHHSQAIDRLFSSLQYRAFSGQL